MKKSFLILLPLVLISCATTLPPAGPTDEMLKEMFAVVGLANKNNKLVDAYQVEVDQLYK